MAINDIELKNKQTLALFGSESLCFLLALLAKALIHLLTMKQIGVQCFAEHLICTGNY